MIPIKSRSLIAIIALVCLFSNLAVARPARATKPLPNDIPKLSDVLTVAKSPLEPVTLKPTLPDGRNTNAALLSEVTTTEGSDPPAREKVTTSEPDEQERDATTSSDPGSSESEQAITTTSASVTTMSPAATTVQSAKAVELSSTTETIIETDATTSEPDLETTTVVSVIKSNPITVPPASTSSPTSGPSTASPEPSTEQQPASTEAPESNTSDEDRRQIGEEKATTTTTTTTPAPNPESVSQPANDSASSEVSVSNIKEDKETSVAEPSTEGPTSTPAPKVVTEPEPTAASELPSSQSTTVSTTTEEQTTPHPLTTSSTTETPLTSESTTSSTTTLKVATVEPFNPPATDKPSPEVDQPAASTTSAPTEDSNKKTDEEKQQACNHLPTYGADEIQKVFREETTYRNGTIKGKFTYLNFDMRYRLVHYTRLPYGPVKIDLVEELGRASNGANWNQSYAPTSLDEIPNAGLQLRNILPNSLFGFPFMGPSSAANQPKPAAGQVNGKPQQLQQNQREAVNDHQDLDRSSMYFYSTDTISTPNLLSPSVPVSVLPNQRRQLDTLANQQDGEKKHAAHEFTGSASPSVLPSAQQHHFQYAAQQPPAVASLPLLQAGPEVKPHVSTYSHLTQAQQYQYSPLPLYSFQQPAYYSSVVRHPVGVPVLPQSHATAFNKPKLDQLAAPVIDEGSISITHHQTHQPHSHEHYIAPFMFSQQPGLHVNDQTETSRLKLRVKTSKALVQEPSGKSAQLKASPSSVYSTPINSPAQNRKIQQQSQQTKQQARHRLGKQNQELKQTINQTPIVYHVLRSPVGRMYTLPQYNQAHAMAYDHED